MLLQIEVHWKTAKSLIQATKGTSMCYIFSLSHISETFNFSILSKTTEYLYHDDCQISNTFCTCSLNTYTYVYM